MKCTSFTANGTPCRYNAKENGLCGIHNKQPNTQGLVQSTFTITLGDQAENHVGMEKIGRLAEDGFNLDDLLRARSWFRDRGINTEIYDLSELVRREGTEVEDAYLLVAKNGLSAICPVNDFFSEQDVLEKDRKALMYGRVVNKTARYNLCFDDSARDPDYPNGKGRIISFNDVPNLQRVRNMLPDIIGDKATELKAEGNYYYDITKCGIGFHGDTERRIVVGVRVGAPMLLRYRWFFKSNPFGPNMDFILGNGDMYIMSTKAVGTDWKTKKIPTLRHAAGCDKFTK